MYDVVIIGAGPAGMAAALRALEKKAKFVVISRDDKEDFIEFFGHLPELKKYE